MAERYPEAEVVLDDELLYEEVPRRSVLRRSDDRPEDIVREGEVLAGKYRVERIPGRHGLGVVVQVRHLELGQEVTLKFLVPEACAYPEFVQRFVREARAAVKIQGEHVARVTDVGRLESGAPYMVREYLRGPDLSEVIKVRGPLPIAEAVDYVVQACEGVAEGHALGVVHRNLRPTSLVVARRSDGTPLIKVFDFAASESLHVNPFTERAVSLVGTSAIMGSLPYLAPEQIRDPHDVDFRADVYSLGAVLYELLGGSPVYAADAAPALLAQVAADAAPSLRTLRQDVPGELDHVVLRCLAKNRAIRYASLSDLVQALAPFASSDVASSIERIVRLGKRTAKVPELASSPENRLPSSLPAAPTPLPARPRQSTQPLNLTEHSVAARHSVHDDVTTINPYSSYAAPVVIHPDHARVAQRSEPVRTEPLPPVRSEPIVAPPRQETLRAGSPEPIRVEPRRTPQPPPLRASVPPPLREASVAVAAVAPPREASVAAAAAPPREASVVTPLPSHEPARVQTSSLPPPAPRSSMSGLSRSWAVPDEPPAPMFTQKRLIALGVVAACAAIGGAFALRSPALPVAAAAPVASVAPAKVEPPPAPAPVEPPPVAASASASAAVVAATPPVASAAPAPVAPAAVAVPAPKPLAVAPPATPRPAAAPVARRPAAQEDAPRKTAAAEPKVASARGGDLFDDPR